MHVKKSFHSPVTIRQCIFLRVTWAVLLFALLIARYTCHSKWNGVPIYRFYSSETGLQPFRARRFTNHDALEDAKFSFVQFSSRWYLCAREGPYKLHPVSQEFRSFIWLNVDFTGVVTSLSGVSTMLPLKQFQCWSDSVIDNGPFSSSQGRSLSASSTLKPR